MPSEDERRFLLRSLTEVGPSKPVGYLPLYTIKDFVQLSPERSPPQQPPAVWRLDRLGRSLVDLVRLVNELGARQVEFRSLSEAIDTSSSGGRLLFHLLAAMAEFERSLISERTRAGMAAAQSQGIRVGRRPALRPEQQSEARRELCRPGADAREIAKRLGVHPRTLLRLVRSAEISENDTA